jgi:hypothetical protein
VRRAMADTLTEISIGYPESPLNGPHERGLAGPAPGERIAPIAGQLPVGAGGSPRFALFAAPGAAASRLLDDFPDLIEPGLRAPLADDGLWLARPDGYVAATAREADAGAIADCLERVRGSGAAA